MNFKSLTAFILLTLIFVSSTCLANKIFVIEGINNTEIKKNILSYLSTTNINCEATETQIDQYLESISTKISNAIRPFGYYLPTIRPEKLPKAKGCWKISLNIDLRDPIIVNQVEIKLTGEAQKSKNNQSQPIFTLKKGSILLHGEYEKYKTELYEKASELGFLDAKFIQNKIDVYPDKHQADISLHFDTGIRYKINNIIIDQSPVFLNDELLLKLISIKKDEYFTNSQLYILRKKLASTGYFEQISVEIDFNNRKDGRVPIKIVVTPGDRIKYSSGIGFSTDAGLRMTFDYNQHRVTDFGYQLNAKLSLSEVISEFSTGLKMPSKSNPINKWYNIEAGFHRERTDTASSDTSKLGLSQTRIHDNKWQNINYIDLVDEKFETGDAQKDSILLVPGTSWSYTKADNLRLPMKGYKMQVEIKAASDSLLSDVSFGQLNLSYKTIIPLKNNNRLIYRGKIGTTLINDLSLLPSSYRYYTGGDNSIRGFNYNTLSPTNDDGDAVGGKHLFISSLEYEYRIGQQWAVAVFADSGNAFSDKFKLEKSAGIGARWFSPIGPVRFDLGFPINDDKSDFQIHITVGPDF